MEVLQVSEELEWMTGLFRSLQPKRVLEIGVYQGGTLRAWMENAPADAHFVAVDIDIRNCVEWTHWLHGLQTLRPVKGSSQDLHVRRVIAANSPYDWVFIDGDHHLEAVAADVELVLPLIRPGGVLALHDIANLGHEGPAEVLADLATEGYDTVQFVADSEVDDPHGVGVVYL